VLLAIAGVLAAALLVNSAILSGNLQAFWAVVHGHQLHVVEDASISSADVVAELIPIAIALVALACAAAAGSRAVGLTWGSLPRQVRVLGDWMLVLGVAMILTGLAVTQLVHLLGGRGVGNDNLNLDAIPSWYIVLKSINAGFTEEIAVIAIAWRLLELIPTRTGRPAFVMTGAATVILLSLRVSYHLYMGIPILFAITLGWLTVRFYRHAHSLGTLIIAHTLFDILGPPITRVPASVLFVACGGTMVWLLTTGPGPFGPHFGLAYGRERSNPTGHLPYQFAWRTPTAATSAQQDRRA